MIGINIFQQQHWYYSYQLPLFAAAGVRWVRPWLFWENSWLFQEPEKGKWDTRELDATLRRLEKYGQKYEYILYNFPSWLVAEKSTQYTQLSEAQTAQWLDYIAKIVKHCAEYVTDFEIWNEPDLLANYNRKFSAEFFSDFTRKTAAAVREANPRARVHILSHSTEREWLRKVGDSGIARHGDVITLHSYASVRRFFQTESIRQRILDCGGFLGIPQYFNEIGFDGYDGCPEYAKAFPNTSERDQARNLVLNTVQTLHVAGPKGKMFYFCSLDPRDSTDPEGRTWDSAFGLLYLGLQPKLGFAALAALAQMIDGHPVLGYVEVRDKIHFTAFSDERAIVWSDAPSGSVQAMKLGCAENEMLKVYDLYGNPVDSGKAAELMLDLSDGPLYVCGSSALGKTAAAFREKWIGDRKKIAEAEHQVGRTEKVSMQRNGVSEISFHIPDGSTVKVSSPRSLELKAESCVADGRCTVKLRAGSVPGAGTVTCKVTLPNADLPQVDRSFPVMIERLALIEDGKFEQGSLAEFTLAGTESIDPESRAMRINGPFKSRTHLYSKLDLSTSRPLHFSVRLKGKLSATAKVSFNVSFFENGQWKGTWTCARLRENTIGSAGFNKYIREIPADISQWTPLQSILPANVLKSQTARAIFFIDVRGGLAGDYILIDDLELYQ
ncbi:MAG: hypothetical protein BWY31_04399 [Lentisphaerae bacterium ADurb.Bin242]|nr:MAG: hypothetical protein BWY31_04399 [Lentisphaerae bacterium ADurb.Bin242]